MMIAIRVDASYQIGSGHVMRCLCLAEYLRGLGMRVVFISRDHPGNLNALIEQRGFKCQRLSAPSSLPAGTPSADSPTHAHWLGCSWQSDAAESRQLLTGQRIMVDLLIVDHYGLDWQWERAMRPLSRHLMCIDDLADRRHEADILLDQNYYRNAQDRYLPMVNADCRLLLCPRHALLRTEFEVILRDEHHQKERSGALRRLLIFFGGMDPANMTTLAIEGALESRLSIAVDVVVGQSNPHRDAIKHVCSQHPQLRFHCQVDYLGRLMSEADLALGAGGSSMLERCAVGLPSAVFVLAENQRKACEDLAAAGACINLGAADAATAEGVSRLLLDLSVDQQRLRKLSTVARSIVPPGGAERVATVLMEVLHEQT